MINLHDIIKAFLAGQKTHSWEGYGPDCGQMSDRSPIEVNDVPQIIVPAGEGVGILNNPELHEIEFFHLGNAILKAAKKKHILPSACDLLIMNHRSGEFILAELTHSNQRAIDGVENSPQEGKAKKAHSQLCRSINKVETAGQWSISPTKKTAIFFFRVKPVDPGIATRTLRAFSMRPTRNIETLSTDPECPGWEFRSHPYPNPYNVS